MCLIISLVLMTFAVNLLIAGDIMMGFGALLFSLFLMSMMVRHFLGIKKERNDVTIKECLSCPTPLTKFEENEK